MSEVYIDRAAVKIAKLGYNAAVEADLRNMILDTSRGTYIGIFIPPRALNMSGFSLTKTYSGANVTAKTYTQDVYFGKTFSRPPVVFAMYRSSRFPGALPYFSESAASLFSDGSGVREQGGSVAAGCNVLNDRVTFFYTQAIYSTNSVTLPGPSAIYYFVSQGA